MWRVERTDDREVLTGHFLLDLACTFLLIGLRIAELRGPVPIGRIGGRFVDALLHPLHDQVQQRYHRLVHLRSCRCTRLKVRDPVGNRSFCLKEGLGNIFQL